jgi:hypothetical protein
MEALKELHHLVRVQVATEEGIPAQPAHREFFLLNLSRIRN